jgi:hypothetical protein
VATLRLLASALIVLLAVGAVVVAERYYGRISPEEFWRRVAEAKVEVIA